MDRIYCVIAIYSNCWARALYSLLINLQYIYKGYSSLIFLRRQTVLAALCINFIRAQKCTAQKERESDNKICDKYIGNFTQHPAVSVCLCQFQYYVEFVRMLISAYFIWSLYQRLKRSEIHIFLLGCHLHSQCADTEYCECRDENDEEVDSIIIISFY